MGAIETVIRLSKTAEHILETDYAAEGRGLHEKLSSAEGKIPPALFKKLRYVATIRNKLVHELNYELENPEEFFITARQAIAELEKLAFQPVKKTEKNTSAELAKNASEEESPLWYSVLFLLFIYIIYQVFIWFIH